jgi:hypothetical protein
MSEKSDRELDELLGRHLGGCLDGQLGRAAAAFGAELRATSPRRTWARWASAGAAVAAGLAVAWLVGHRAAPHQNVTPEVVISNSADEAPPMVQSASWSRMVDDGTAVVDDRPVRRLRRKVVEEVEWYDAKAGATVRTTMPRQQIFLIGMKTD